jgi:hypothetical protein
MVTLQEFLSCFTEIVEIEECTQSMDLQYR